MMEHITNQERMNCFLRTLGQEKNPRKEYVNVYGLAAEIFEESLIPFIPEILSQSTKRLNEGTSNVHQAYADAMGAIVHHVVNNLTDFDEIDNVMDTVFTMIFANMNQQSRIVQAGASTCLTKVIQSTPLDSLLAKLPTVCQSIIDTMTTNGFKAHTQILECLISLILNVEKEFEQFAVNFLPMLLECT